VVGCDGRHSIVREQTGLKLECWVRQWTSCGPRQHRDGDPKRGDGASMRGLIVMLDRGDYWQCAYVIPRAAADRVRAKASTRCARRCPGYAGFEQRLSELTSRTS